jgi:hypothetical protein
MLVEILCTTYSTKTSCRTEPDGFATFVVTTNHTELQIRSRITVTFISPLGHRNPKAAMTTKTKDQRPELVNN